MASMSISLPTTDSMRMWCFTSPHISPAARWHHRHSASFDAAVVTFVVALLFRARLGQHTHDVRV